MQHAAPSVPAPTFPTPQRSGLPPPSHQRASCHRLQSPPIHVPDMGHGANIHVAFTAQSRASSVALISALLMHPGYRRNLSTSCGSLCFNHGIRWLPETG
ncbi:hypothetical protein NDU88_002483 [Pleurodeles waltl]|uniref:Uncharacterized protein n=1 Tax=Pleurodeles waltl TaxID=8319 RepID=A0AAV7P8E1_PLEWA|nr:hypothetical protein NDU88_002483 [Pleurodeles waltl]